MWYMHGKLVPTTYRCNDSKCTQIVTFYVALKSTWIFYFAHVSIKISTHVCFQVRFGDGNGRRRIWNTCACKAGQVRIHAYCQKHMHLVSSSDKVNTQRFKKILYFPKYFQILLFYSVFFFFLKYNSTNMEVIIAAVWYVISDLIPSINFKFLAWCELIWLISSTFLTGISFYFNEKLSHHLLTK